jgi:hypothetical protein
MDAALVCVLKFSIQDLYTKNIIYRFILSKSIIHSCLFGKVFYQIHLILK